ncbi:hypothetical protein Sjap_007144 [Stephania japonica]|uniref:Uncharacterized protein n=1 Tax=Stephania japonica TaxID=461633 RepID=A0AAP0JMV5_9MAGN
MTFSVTRLPRAIVRPSEPTPSGQLKLSVIDRLPSLRCYARTLHVFKDGHEVSAEVIRVALSKALVPYYPLAGRLLESSEDELHISCTGEGVWFVAASTSCTLESLNYFDDAPSVPHDDLLPDSIPETESLDPLVLMQVTSFKCGGYVIGLTFCHSICDGLGAAQFLNAVGEFARGFAHPSIEPIWFREVLPSPVREPKLPPLQLMPNYQLKHASIDIPAQKIDQLKQEFFHLTGRSCSTFEVVAAAIWRSRTQVINFSKNSIVKLVFFANTRHLLNPPAPQGFYGNCFFPVIVTVSSGWLVETSHGEVVKIIKEAKARLPTEFNKWIYTGADEGEEPFAPPLNYTTLFISEWGRLGFNEVDYGSGCPLYVMPIQGSSIIPVGIVCLPPRPEAGIRLMTWCVEGSHLPFLLDQMTSLV